MAKFVPAGNGGKPGKSVGASKGKFGSGASSTKKTVRVSGNKNGPAGKAKKAASGGSALVKKNVNNAVGSVKRKASRGKKSK